MLLSAFLSLNGAATTSNFSLPISKKTWNGSGIKALRSLEVKELGKY